jgi:hypothetical protein
MQFASGMHEMASMFELQAQAKGFGVWFDVQGHVPQWVRADEKRVRQICSTCWATPSSSRSRQRAPCLRYAREMAHIEVHDTGPGMDAQELERIFEPFHTRQQRGQRRRSQGGAGLGLTIAKMLTDLMGGELSVTSTPGVGSMFRVRLFLPELHRPPSVTSDFGVREWRKPRRVMPEHAAKFWSLTTKKPTANCWSMCCSRWALKCELPPAATTRWTCWPPATSPMCAAGPGHARH